MALSQRDRQPLVGVGPTHTARRTRQTTGQNVPSWAKQMQIFILEDMNELDAARTMIASLLESGRIHDPAEIRFLKERLEELAARQARRR